MDQNLTVVQIAIIIVGIIFALYVIQYATDTNRQLTGKSLSQTVQNNPQSIVLSNSNPVQEIPSKPSTQINPKAQYTLFNFYSPHCPYSRQFNVTWEQLSHKLSSIPDLNMRAVDASDPENENLAFYYGVEGFPTIMFVGPTKKEKYVGSRDIDSVTQYVLDKLRS